jgi:hypothetical protein
MKTLIATMMIAAACAPSMAQASAWSYYECDQIRNSPPDRSRDPIIKIKLGVVWSPANVPRPTEFSAVHYSASGEQYARLEQYRDIHTWDNREGSGWSGVLVRNPAMTMVGTVTEHYIPQPRVDKYRWAVRSVTYVEKIFKHGRLETVISSVCRDTTAEEVDNG